MKKIYIKVKLIIAEFKLRFRIKIKKDKLKFRFNNSISAYTITKFLSSDYEAEEMFILRTMNLDGQKILELGTGLGLVSLTCARLNPTAEVISYDINESMTALAKENAKLNSIVNVEYRTGSVSNNFTSEYTDFNVSKEILKSSWTQKNFTHSDRFTAVSVKNIALKSLIHEEKFSTLIVDVEGFEEVLFTGSWLNDCKIHTIMIEYHPWLYDFEVQKSIERSILDSNYRIDIEYGNVKLYTKRAPLS